MPAIRLETVNDLIAHDHEMYAWCPGCKHSREIDLDRLVRLGKGKKRYCELRMSCRTCGARAELRMRGPTTKLQRPRPDNVIPLVRR